MKKQILFFVSFLIFCFATTVWAGVAENAQLIDAIRANNPIAAREAIEAGADVNQRVINGNTPLHLAVLNPISPERKEIIMLLVRNGARVNTQNNTDELPVDLARTMPDFEDIQSLLGYDASCAFCAHEITPKDDFVRGSDFFGCDPRHIFHRACLFDETGAQRTVQCPTCRATRDESAAAAERDALMAHYTATEAHPDTEEVHPEVDLTQPETEDAQLEADLIPAETLLINAAHVGNLAQVEALLDTSEVDIDATDWRDQTALMVAAAADNTMMVRWLLLLGANVNASSRDGWTALISAANSGDMATVQELLISNANPNAIGSHGDSTALGMAIQRNHIEMTNTLLEYGADANIPTFGLPALIFATRRNTPEIVQALLNYGANVDAVGRDGWTALMYAAGADYTEIVRALLNHSANVNASSRDGWTALSLCRPNSEIEHLLIASGARRHR